MLVYRLGGTSHDVSIVSITNGMYRILAYQGDQTLGGRNFDELIVNHLASEFNRLVKYIQVMSGSVDGRVFVWCQLVGCGLIVGVRGLMAGCWLVNGTVSMGTGCQFVDSTVTVVYIGGLMIRLRCHWDDGMLSC